VSIHSNEVEAITPVGEEALRRRLQRLGRKRRGSTVKMSNEFSLPGNDLPAGVEVSTPFGDTYLIQTRYPMDYQHGKNCLSDILQHDTVIAAEVARQPSLREASIERLIFIDTETTGLVGGAGTIAFMIGVGAFVEDSFLLRQYFLRDPSEERGMLFALQEDLESAEGFVSYNGRAFDLPLLEMRYMLGLRRHWSLSTWPQLDLLHPARRLWRLGLPDCTLGTLEKMQLNVNRTEEDVPGSMIPGLYLDYLRSGDASQMARIVYHNAVDILTLVGLAAQILDRYKHEDSTMLSGAEALAVARWHHEAGRLDAAESAYIRAIASTKSEVRVDALRRYTAHLKRQDRRGEAVEGWHTLHTLTPDDPGPCVELAKYYEWYAQDLAQAQQWAQEALVCLSHWVADWRRDQVWAEIEHRLERLARKIGGGEGSK
jgi:uncharacterized protein YprB with RNaseH-like and TPR domain